MLTPEFSCGTLAQRAQSRLLASEASQPLIMMPLTYRQLQRTLDSLRECAEATTLTNRLRSIGDGAPLGVGP